MGEVKLGVWNVEWMNDLFEGDPPAFKGDAEPVRGPRKGNTVADRRDDIIGVINDLSVDCIVVVEGPNRVYELQLLFDRPELNGDWVCTVQPSGSQSIGLAVRVDEGTFKDPAVLWFDARSADSAPVLSSATNPFEMDTDGDGVNEIHKFERRPLYAELTLSDDTRFRVLGVHLKSKGVFGSYEWTKWWSMAEGNRKKLLAQCYQLRQKFLNVYLTDAATSDIPLIVCGDINDGPGFDTSEMKLQASGVERLMGSVWSADLCLGNALFDSLSPNEQDRLNFSKIYTASFEDPIFDGIYQRVWIDHILYTKNKKGWVKDAAVRVEMPDGQMIYKKYPNASDHFPISCKVTTD